MVGHWFHTAADFATTWLPLAFFGILVLTAWLLWKTVGMMPRVRPTHARLAREVARDVGRRGRGRGGARRADGGRRLPARPEAVRAPRREGAEGPAPLRAAGHRQDAAREGGRPRVGRELLLRERVVVRRDVRRPRRGPHPQAVRRGAQERARDRLHRRARRRRRAAHRPRLQPRAGPDAQPAARRARRLRGRRAGRRDGRLQPHPGSRPGAAAPGPLRPADARAAARPRRPRGDPRRAHARQAARRGRRPAHGRAPDERPHRRRAREHLQRGRDLRRPPRRAVRHAGATSTPRSSASSPASSRRRC